MFSLYCLLFNKRQHSTSALPTEYAQHISRLTYDVLANSQTVGLLSFHRRMNHLGIKDPTQSIYIIYCDSTKTEQEQQQ